MTIKKQHHYVAETYLKNFANAEDRVFMYRKDDPQRVISQRPNELACHKHYFRQPKPGGGWDNNSLEDLFAEVEKQWPTVVDRLCRRENVNDLLEALFQFIALHRVRVPAARDACEAMLAEMVKSTGRHLDRTSQLPPIPDSLAKFGNIWDLIQVSIDPHQSIHAMVDVLRGVGKLFEKIGLGALHNTTTTRFLTSDNPVIWFDPTVSDAEMRPYAIQLDGPIMMLFPVSPTIMLVGHSALLDSFANHGLGYGELSDTSQVERMNTQVCRFAYEAVFASEETHANLVAKHSSVSPVVVTHRIPAVDGDLIHSSFEWGPRRKKPKWKGPRDDKTVA